MGRKYVRAARLSDIPEKSGLGVTLNGRSIALFRVDGRCVAIEDSCPHMGAILSTGFCTGRVLTCNCHGWQFDLTTGNCLTLDGEKVRTYPVRIEGEEVWVRV